MKRKLLTYFVAAALGMALITLICFLAWVLNTYGNAMYWALAVVVCAYSAYILHPVAVNIVNYFNKEKP